jgi:hypothetical protein
VARRPAGARPIATFIAGVVEFLLAVTGLGYWFLGSDRESWVALFLTLWGLTAVGYLLVGAVRMRRRALTDTHDEPEPSLPGWSTYLTGRRFSFLLTVAASVTGLYAALYAIGASDTSDFAPVVKGLGVVVMVCAWMLLHVGYARFYAQWPEWRFPAVTHPHLPDFLYFSFTLGVSFAASDVEVRSRRLRWHVMVHSIISFFYNAVVLAVAVSIITGK